MRIHCPRFRDPARLAQLRSLRAASVSLLALGVSPPLAGARHLEEEPLFLILWSLFVPLRRQAREVTLASP